MRIIAGSHRGRHLCGPQGTTLRPTSDKVREALFSILGARVSGGRFLDLYAGTGAVGIEAISRGATAVTFVECDSRALQVLRKNLAACGFEDHAHVRVGRTENFLARPDWWDGPYGVVFADPPYADTQAIETVRIVWATELLAEDGVMVIEQDVRAVLPPSVAGAALIRRYVYGDTALFLYGAAPRPGGSA